MCDVDPLNWEDRDIIRLEIKQLCDSFEGVCASLRSTDELLVSGKRSRLICTTPSRVSPDHSLILTASSGWRGSRSVLSLAASPRPAMNWTSRTPHW
jgi:hypothetical protein